LHSLAFENRFIKHESETNTEKSYFLNVNTTIKFISQNTYFKLKKIIIRFESIVHKYSDLTVLL